MQRLTIAIVMVLAGMTMPATAQVTANRTNDLVRSMGMNVARAGSGTTTIANMTYLGLTAVRESMPFATDGGGFYNSYAAAGLRMNFALANDSDLGSGQLVATSLANTFTKLDLLATTWPGSVLALEGPNEVNNFPVWYVTQATTNGTTAAGNAVLHFAATLPAVLTLAGTTWKTGLTITDVTTPTAIPAGTTLSAATATTVTMTANAAGAGVGSGDTIKFEANSLGHTSADPVVQTAAIGWTQDLFTVTNADANLSSVPVVNFTDFVAGQPCGGAIGIAGTADYNNQHIYPNLAGQPAFWFSPFWMSNCAYITITGAPLAVTEGGYSSLPNDVSNSGVDTTTQARLEIDMYLDAYRAGAKYTLLYYMYDTGGCASTTLFDHYGFFDCNNLPKANATAVHNLTTILLDTGIAAASFTPNSLNYTASNLPAKTSGTDISGGDRSQGGGYTLLLQKSNGNFYLAIWNEPVIWNATTHVQVTPPTVVSTVSLGATFQTARIYDPIISSAPQTTLANVNSLAVNLGADPLIVELVPASSPTCP